MSAQDKSQIADTLRQRIPDAELDFTFDRSSGPGGQNVNKVNTRVTLWFDLEASPSLNNAEKRRIATRLRGRIDKTGRLRVVSMRHRTQRANREAATDRFFELLAGALVREKKRIPTRTPLKAKRRRLRKKREQSEKKRLRARPDSTD